MPAKIRITQVGVGAFGGELTPAKIVAAARKRDKALEGYTNTKMRQLWRDAIRAALRGMVQAWVNSGSIDTGMSVASLLPLARAKLGRKRFRIGGVAKVQEGIGKRKFRPRKGKPYVVNVGSGSIAEPKRNKTIEEGIAAGEDSFSIIVGTPKNPFYRFDFDIKVFQWLAMEGHLAGGPIHALEKGGEEMRKYIRQNYTKYLSAADYAAIFAGEDGRVAF